MYIDNDNVTVSIFHSALSVDIDSMSSELKQYTDEKFNVTDIDYMYVHMVNDSHSYTILVNNYYVHGIKLLA